MINLASALLSQWGGFGSQPSSLRESPGSAATASMEQNLLTVHREIAHNTLPKSFLQYDHPALIGVATEIPIRRRTNHCH